MDSFEFNKIMGAVLGTLLFVMGAGFVAEAIYAPHKNVGPGYTLPEPEATETADAGAPAVEAVPLAVLLASGDATRGQAAVRKCQSCHNFGEGEPSKQGPHLYGVVGRPEGDIADFSYSDGMKAHHANGDVWSYENLDAFIAAPKVYTPGTKMAFAGVKSPTERADILAYLQTLSASPVPFPTADAAPADAAPADAAAPAADAAAPAEAAPADAAPAAAPAETPATDAAPAPEAAPAPAAETPAPAATAAPEATPAPATP